MPSVDRAPYFDGYLAGSATYRFPCVGCGATIEMPYRIVAQGLARAA